MAAHDDVDAEEARDQVQLGFLSPSDAILGVVEDAHLFGSDHQVFVGVVVVSLEILDAREEKPRLTLARCLLEEIRRHQSNEVVVVFGPGDCEGGSTERK